MSENLSAQHWNYFKAICDDVEKLGRYVELGPDNYKTYSLEIVRLLFATCSEIDVILKLLCAKIVPGTKADNIKAYCPIITDKYHLFTKTPIEAAALSCCFVPWENWTSADPPAWWIANNKVKHRRNEFFHTANVGNLLHAVAGLLVVLCYYQEKALNEPRRSWPNEFMQIKTSGIERLLGGGIGA